LSSGTANGLEDFEFDETSARYVRVNCDGNTESDWDSILELVVTGR
jgi:hypothetical protein